VSATVQTTAGAVRGTTAPNGFAFLGVPYADPPFGRNRFQSPVPVTSWDGVRDCIAHAPTAPQPEVGFTIIPEPTIDGGDAPACLSLNVFTPDPGAAGLPVLVWIHGGGFVTGTPSSAWYDGRSFNRDGIVVVSVGYRLGAEGFLHIDGAPTNRGVRDWLAALAWVQENIAAFGGDPHRVTIGGQSAGGAAVTTLATMPAARGLFQRVIPMSGSAFRRVDADRSRTVTERVAAELAVAPTFDALSAVTIAELVRAQTAVLAARDPEGAPADAMMFFPYVDGDLVPTHASDAVGAGDTDHLAFLIGATSEEFNAAAGLQDLDDATTVRRLGRMGLDDAGIAAYRAAHPSLRNGHLVGQGTTDVMFRVPAVRIAEARAGRAETFHYDFRWRTPGLGGAGAIHCLDLPFAWDLLDAEHVDVIAGGEPPQALADAMHRAWVGFITDGDPGWPAYDLGVRPTMVFDETPKVVDDAMSFERSTWP
jgi:para-nitrobenzyl esterase